ncbi:MAG: winged helix-turn-helix transcriptional regulator [Deltaproteobacteria bacterium]|nr:winged helix-turn-helix transcriptional regulator [Deltaproteobacteria bacterium]
MELLKADPNVTITQLAEMTRKSRRTILRKLKEYQNSGLLRREGSRKKGRWIVL